MVDIYMYHLQKKKETKRLFNISFFLSSLTGNASQRLVDPQPETRAMMNFIQSHRFTLSVALDGGALVATYPYDKPVQTGNTTMTRNKKYIVYKNLRTPG